jgi:hypothetical protein
MQAESQFLPDLDALRRAEDRSSITPKCCVRWVVAQAASKLPSRGKPAPGTFEKGNEMKKLLSAAAIASALIMPPCGTCSSPMRETLGAFLQK